MKRTQTVKLRARRERSWHELLPVIGQHVNREGRCAACASCWPCQQAELAEFSLGAL